MPNVLDVVSATALLENALASMDMREKAAKDRHAPMIAPATAHGECDEKSSPQHWNLHRYQYE